MEAGEPTGRAPVRGRTRSRVPAAEIAELRDVRFPTGMRGYDREAVEIREVAEARVSELEADARAILEERARLIGELRDLLRRLGELAEGAAGRYPTASPPSPAEEEPPSGVS